jgi:flagellar hook protein FlgE
MLSFSTPLSGLNANSEDLTVISNNLANLNTVAYKGDQASFEDLFYQQLGSSGNGNPIQVGVGTQISSISTEFTQGGLQGTGVPTDVAIQGDGFFLLSNNGIQEFTRAGNFSIASNGSLVAADGSLVLGNPAVNGVITPSPTPTPISIPTGLTTPPKATSTVGITLNLDSGTAIGGTFSTSASVHDALGQVHVLTYTFTKTAANTWGYAITIPGADVGSATPVTVNSGTLMFSGSGVLTSPNKDVAGIGITGFSDGAANLTFTWQLFNANTGPLLTQFSGPSATSATQDDGYAAGTLQTFNIQADGTIQGVFSNGQTQPLGQITIATFADEQGLLRNGSNEFLQSLSSGAPNIGTPGTGGRGTLAGGSLEQSNVDISGEFASLILAERGFQANARVVTTFDQVIQAAIALSQ